MGENIPVQESENRGKYRIDSLLAASDRRTSQNIIDITTEQIKN